MSKDIGPVGEDGLTDEQFQTLMNDSDLFKGPDISALFDEIFKHRPSVSEIRHSLNRANNLYASRMMNLPLPDPKRFENGGTD